MYLYTNIIMYIRRAQQWNMIKPTIEAVGYHNCMIKISKIINILVQSSCALMQVQCRQHWSSSPKTFWGTAMPRTPIAWTTELAASLFLRWPNMAQQRPCNSEGLAGHTAGFRKAKKCDSCFKVPTTPGMFWGKFGKLTKGQNDHFPSQVAMIHL